MLNLNTYNLVCSSNDLIAVNIMLMSFSYLQLTQCFDEIYTNPHGSIRLVFLLLEGSTLIICCVLILVIMILFCYYCSELCPYCTYFCKVYFFNFPYLNNFTYFRVIFLLYPESHAYFNN